MTDRDAGSAAQTEPKRLRFDRYVLDLHRGCLLLDGSEIALRPKTFAVLRYLTENSGRLVSKDELFAAVWPNLAITDDALVQSIGELRRALGDDGPRLIRTTPRRGYRLESTVSVIAPADPSPAAGTPDPTAASGKAQFSGSPSRHHTLALLKTLLIDWRKASVAALAFVAVLAAGTVWTIRGVVRNVDRPAKSADLDTKAAIAVLPDRASELRHRDDDGVGHPLAEAADAVLARTRRGLRAQIGDGALDPRSILGRHRRLRSPPACRQ